MSKKRSQMTKKIPRKERIRQKRAEKYLEKKLQLSEKKARRQKSREKKIERKVKRLKGLFVDYYDGSKKQSSWFMHRLSRHIDKLKKSLSSFYTYELHEDELKLRRELRQVKLSLKAKKRELAKKKKKADREDLLWEERREELKRLSKQEELEKNSLEKRLKHDLEMEKKVNELLAPEKTIKSKISFWKKQPSEHREDKEDQIKRMIEERQARREKRLAENARRVEEENRKRENAIRFERERRVLKHELMLSAKHKTPLSVMPMPPLPPPDFQRKLKDIPAEKKTRAIKKKEPEQSWLRSLFKRDPIEIRVDLDKVVDQQSDPNTDSLMKKVEVLEHREEKRHEHEQLLNERLAEKEAQKITRDLSRIPHYAMNKKMDLSQQKKIASDREKIQHEIAAVQEKIRQVDASTKSEIDRAVETIKKDHLLFKPRELVLEKEHLIAEHQHQEKTTFLLHQIAQARKEMMKLHLRKVEKIYKNVLQAYLTLPANEQRVVYDELNDLYSERKKAELLLVKH